MGKERGEGTGSHDWDGNRNADYAGDLVMDYSWLLVIPIGCFVFCIFALGAWPIFKDWLDD